MYLKIIIIVKLNPDNEIIDKLQLYMGISQTNSLRLLPWGGLCKSWNLIIIEPFSFHTRYCYAYTLNFQV